MNRTIKQSCDATIALVLNPRAIDGMIAERRRGEMYTAQNDLRATASVIRKMLVKLDAAMRRPPSPVPVVHQNLEVVAASRPDIVVKKAKEIVDRQYKGTSDEILYEKVRHAQEKHQSVFDTVYFGGKPIGDFWYHELEAYRIEGTRQAALCAAIQGYGVPDKPVQVRRFVKAADLLKMVSAANFVARCPLSEHRMWMTKILKRIKKGDTLADLPWPVDVHYIGTTRVVEATPATSQALRRAMKRVIEGKLSAA